MATAAVLFPHQLFAHHPALSETRAVFLVEEQLFFGDWFYPARFHKQKLIFHRATMKAWAARLEQQKYQVHYIPHRADPAMAYLFDSLKKKKIDRVVMADPVDCMLRKRMERETTRRGVGLTVLPTPGFLTEETLWREWLQGRKQFTMAGFYKKQRIRTAILMAGEGPVGGRWSLDDENRKSLPKGLAIPEISFPRANRHAKEACTHVARTYANHPGEAACRWPVTHKQAASFLQTFVETRLAFFGDYEDAMAADEPFLFHSLLSPLLNCGLLTPQQVLNAVLKADDVPLNSREGFVRQVLGWREFVRAVYELDGVRQRTTNTFAFTRPLPTSFYTGNTGIPPLDTVIQRVLQNAYAHHIERLMILGNFMLLCEIDPDHVYQWFMELFLDAADWVMVPNVYGMSQYADGGRMVSKPYISGSSYVCRMGHWEKGPWCEIWDGLFWRFVNRHRDLLSRNHRLGLMVRQCDRLKPERRRRLFAKAEAFLAHLFPE